MVPAILAKVMTIGKKADFMAKVIGNQKEKCG